MLGYLPSVSQASNGPDEEKTVFTSNSRVSEIEAYLNEYFDKCLRTLNNRIADTSTPMETKRELIELRQILTNGLNRVDQSVDQSRLTTQFYWNYQINVTYFIEKSFNKKDIWVIPKPTEFENYNESNRNLLKSLVKWQILNRVSYATLYYKSSPLEIPGAIRYYKRELERLKMTNYELETIMSSAKKNSQR